MSKMECPEWLQLMCLAETAGLSWDAGAAGCFSFPLSLSLYHFFLYFSISIQTQSPLHIGFLFSIFMWSALQRNMTCYMITQTLRSANTSSLPLHSIEKASHSISSASIWRGQYEVINIEKHSSLEAIFGEWIPYRIWWEQCPQSSQILTVWKFVIHR